MMTIDALVTFFGWCSVINIIFLTFTAVLILLLKNPLSQLHSKLLGVDQTFVLQAYFNYMANYKIALLLLNIVPYFALKIMS